MPLAGSRDSVPCGVWGNAPTVPRATNSKEEVNKGAGSEASLPVTSRSRRSAPSRFISHLHIVAPDGRDRPASGEVVFSRCWSFLLQGNRARRSPEGDRKALWKYANNQIGKEVIAGCLKSGNYSLLQGFRACGRDQRAFRSPFGNLRAALPCYLTFIGAVISYLRA